MPPSRKRRAPVVDENEESEASAPEQTQSARRRRSTPPDEQEEEEIAGQDADSQDDSGSTPQQQMVKNLVRLALASEHTRIPIRRADIAAKALGGGRSRQFKTVFDEAQLALRSTFGMELVELPAREKVTMTQKRAAAKSQSQGTASAQASNKAWVLCSVLPAQYRDADILTPAKVPTAELESSYIGLYSLVISAIALAGGQLPEARLERILRRMNAEQTTPIDKTDKTLARMEKQGYIVKVKETSGGEEQIDYVVGPRGKVELGQDGVAGLVRTVYGLPAEGPGPGPGAEANTELERRLARSLKVAGLAVAQEPALNGNAPAEGAGPTPSGRRRPRRGQGGEDDDFDV